MPKGYRITKETGELIGRTARRALNAPADLTRRKKLPQVGGSGGAAYKPPMWPDKAHSDTNFRVRVKPFYISNNPIEIGTSGVFLGDLDSNNEPIDHIDLGAFGLMEGIFYCKCVYDANNEITDAQIYSGSSLPSDVIDDYFHIVTHVYYSWETEPGSGVFKLTIRPLYFGSLVAIRFNNGTWRW